MGKWSSFIQGYGLGQRMVEDYNKSQKKRELEEIAKAQESDITQTLEATPEQKARAEAETASIAAQDAKDFGLEQPMDFRPVSNQVIQKTGVSFLGKEYDKPLSDSEKDLKRQTAMAGIFEKYGDVEGGMRLRREAKTQQRDDQRFAWEQDRVTREKTEYDEKQADKTLLKTIDTDVGEFVKKRTTAQDGTVRDLTPDDTLAINQYRAAKLFGAGKIAEASALAKDNLQMAKTTIDLQTEQRKAAIPGVVEAAKGGDFEPLKAYYDRFIPDGAKVTNIAMGKDGKVTVERETVDGKKLPVKTFDSVDQVTKGVMTTASAEMAYNISQNEFRNNLEVQRLQLSKNADARAGAQFAQGQADRKDEKTEKEATRIAEYNLWKEQNPNATPAQDAAAKARILKPRTNDGVDITSDYKPDSYGTGGTAIQKDKNGNIVVTRVDSGKPGQSFSIAPPGQKPAQQSATPTASHINALISNPDQAAAFDAKFGKGAAQSVLDAARQAPKAAPQAPSQQPAPRQAPAAPAVPVQAPTQAPATKPSVASVLGVSGNGGAMDAIMTNKAAALESAAAQLKQSQQVFASAARSGDSAAMRQYQADIVQKRDALSRLLTSMNDQQRSAVVSALGV